MEVDFTAAERYAALESNREAPLRRARNNATLTLPYISPPDGFTEADDLEDPVQNVGSLGVRNLAAKTTRAAFPANEPFWRHDADEIAAEEAENEEEGTTEGARKILAQYDRAVMHRIEALGDRTKVEMMNKRLLIEGNSCLDIRKPKARVIPMSHYVVARDARGTVLEAVIVEKVHPDSAPPEVVNDPAIDTEIDETKASASSEPLDLFTHLHLKGEMYHGFQEINGERVQGSDFSHKKDELPFLFLRFIVVDGESWGRSFVEEIYGDLESLEALSRAILDAVAAGSKVVWFVNPNGSTATKDLADAENLDVIAGNADDVSTLQLGKSLDIQLAYNMANDYANRLKEAFLMNQSATREAERVTAEEVRFLAVELEEVLSGFYTTLSEDFQKPYVRIRIKQMKDLPALPEDTINLTITTGLDALRKGRELEKLRVFRAEMVAAYGADALSQVLPAKTFADRLTAALGLNLSAPMKTEEEARQQQTADQVTAQAIEAAPQMISQGMSDG